jgi:hypothetical protein
MYEFCICQNDSFRQLQFHAVQKCLKHVSSLHTTPGELKPDITQNLVLC